MRTATSKHLTVVRGLAKFARVTVGRADQSDVETVLPEPQIILNDRAVPRLSDVDRQIIEAARRGISETESHLGWRGAQHFVIKIEGLMVDGIDAEAAFVAAREATQELIQRVRRAT